MKEELTELLENRIYTIRGQRVMIDSDLAQLYGVETKRLNEAVKRNIERFPQDFMFQLTQEEVEILRSQFATSSWGGNRYLPYVFTEHGVTMLSSVLHSKKAVEINIQVVRAFIKLREYALNVASDNTEIKELKKLLMLYIEKNDKRVNEIIQVLNNLIEQPKETKHIGFEVK